MARLVTSGRTAEGTLWRVLAAGACVFFFAFVTARAVRVPLTYDEAATYLRYISTDVLSLFNFDVATNHFLNTVLTKAFYLVGGDRELALRMPNLIGYGMYLCFSLLILKGLAHRAIAFAGFLLLNLNPYVLDFFSLSRGYGLSLGFMMGSLFFLLEFVAQLRTRAVSHRHLSHALLFACGAVMANFSQLDVYFGVFAVGLVALAIFNSITGTAPALRSADTPASAGRRRPFPWLVLVAPLFLLLVFSQDAGLSEELYEPVAVSLVGLSPSEIDAVTVSRLDIGNRPRRLPHTAGANEWHVQPRADVRGLQIDLPAAAADKLSRHLVRIDLTIGSRRAFWNHGHEDETWTIHTEDDRRVFESGPSLSLPKSRMPGYRPLINWRGDRTYVEWLLAYIAFALSVLGGLAILLKGVGVLAVRAHVLTGDQWRPVASSALWLAALAGTPMYLLKRDAELYYGGTHGLVQDTFSSLIDGSFYGNVYHAAQIQFVFAGIVLTLLAFIVVLYLSVRRETLSSALAAASLLAIMVIASLAVVGQRFLFETPYLLSRTALFYIPLYVLFVTFLCDSTAELGKAAAMLAASALAVALSFSIYHFMATANLRYTQEWRSDADTKAMIEDLGHITAAEQPTGSRVVLGVDWMFSPVAAFYATKNTPTVIDVVVVPSWRARESEFLYVEDRNRADLNVIRRYPVAHTVLARVGPR